MSGKHQKAFEFIQREAARATANGAATLVCPACKSASSAELYPSKTDPSGFTLYCRRCEEGCVSPGKAVEFPDPGSRAWIDREVERSIEKGD